MSLAVHIAVGTALAVGCATGIISTGYLAGGWRLRGLLDDRAGSRDRALAGVFIMLWMLLSFGPWLAGLNSVVVLVTTSISLVPLALAVRFLVQSSARRRRKV
jgi:hypothetical protein